ncbi:MAG: carbohydrate ABC transporter permease [Christensenellales bacterium]
MKVNNRHSLSRSLERKYRLLVVPALFLIFALIIFPLFFNFYISFTNFSLLKKGYKFVGLRNYTRFFSDSDLSIILGNTAKYVFWVVAFQFILGFVSALMLSYIKRMRGVISAILFMPWVISQVFAVAAWKLLFNDSYGLINYALQALGLAPIGWMADKNLALNVVILLNIWAGYGFSMTVQLGAIQNVPRDLYEAARVDGANWFRQLLSITLPLIRYTIMTNMIFITISTFNIFAYVFALTAGGPIRYSEVIGLTMYNTAFMKGAMGQGAAISTLMLGFNAFMALLYVVLFKSQAPDTL